MLAAVFNFGKTIVRKGIHWLNQKLQQWSRPTDGRAVPETVTDLMRPKSELVLENALLRQQVIVLRRQVKRPNDGVGERSQIASPCSSRTINGIRKLLNFGVRQQRPEPDRT
jgi:hypothetical protein